MAGSNPRRVSDSRAIPAALAARRRGAPAHDAIVSLLYRIVNYASLAKERHGGGATMGPSDVQGLYAELAKRAAELAKNKEEMADKNKAAAVKDLGDNLKTLKKIADEQAHLKKLVDSIASLQKDIDKLKAEYTKYINDSVKLSNVFVKINPDPKGRPYFMVANFLGGSHPALSLDMPAAEGSRSACEGSEAPSPAALSLSQVFVMAEPRPGHRRANA